MPWGEPPALAPHNVTVRAGETTELQGNVAKDYDPVLDREKAALRGAHERPWQKHQPAPQLSTNDPATQSWRTAPEQTTSHHH
jgi:hypothetical protein